MKNFLTFSIMTLICLFFFGCSSNPEKMSFDEKIYQKYVDSNRIEKYTELKNKYDGNRMILWWNRNEDAWGITNSSFWLLDLILPDLPDTLGVGAILVILLYLGAFGVGGAILGALAKIGALFGGIGGIPPAIMGIIWLGIAFRLLVSIFEVIQEWFFS